MELRPVPPFATVNADERFRVPKLAFVEKRLVDEAVVANLLVEVALVVVELRAVKF